MMQSENMHFSKVGLALTPDEEKVLKTEGIEFTGWYNQHGQPILRDIRTGKELPLCRSYNPAITCGECR